MGIIKGNPIALVAMFFGAAVLLMGGLYALVPRVMKDPSPVLISIAVLLALSLGFALLIIGRVFWVIARNTYGPAPAKASSKK